MMETLSALKCLSSHAYPQVHTWPTKWPPNLSHPARTLLALPRHAPHVLELMCAVGIDT